jgi:regulation of enolase protein 1 (concanavalin A-like superfamily)
MAIGPQFLLGAEPKVIFEDPLKEKLGEGWSWLRENPKTWRHTAEGLEIRVEPGVAPTVKNALVRRAPDRSQGKYAIEVTVEFTSPPSRLYEQAGITWYQGNKPVFKLVHELIEGKTYIIPGKKPTETKVMQLRLVVSKKQFSAQYRPDGQGEFQTAADGELPSGSQEKVSIQCYNGPPDAEHWMRFSNFKIIKLAE